MLIIPFSHYATSTCTPFPTPYFFNYLFTIIYYDVPIDERECAMQCNGFKDTALYLRYFCTYCLFPQINGFSHWFYKCYCLLATPTISYCLFPQNVSTKAQNLSYCLLRHPLGTRPLLEFGGKQMAAPYISAETNYIDYII